MPAVRRCRADGRYKRKYWGIIAYNRKLTDSELTAYDLDYIGEDSENES